MENDEAPTPGSGWTLPTFLDRLTARRLSYYLARYRDSILVTVATPGVRWEVEFMDDGGIEVEKFTSSGDMGGAAWVDDLLAIGDEGVATE